MLSIIILILGIILLVLGAELTVEAAKNLSAKFGISHAFVGLTIISIGTSLPEIATNIFSGIKNLGAVDASGIAVGTNIGSCLTQITLILGITALLGTMHATKKTIKRDGFMILMSIAVMFLFGSNGFISRIEGIILITGYIVYLYIVSKDHAIVKNIKEEISDSKNTHIRSFNNIVIMCIGIALLIIGTKFVVENALQIAESFGLAQSFVGVVIIGVGGALPELFTACRAIVKGAHGISLGTLIGSNITDPLFSLGSGAVIAGFAFDKNLLWFDLPFWFFATAIALLMIKKDLKIGKENKTHGIILIAIYAVFIIVKILHLNS
ncbi:MAG: calcium/sodium antiporter [Nanoarchaeota archaeon]